MKYAWPIAVVVVLGMAGALRLPRLADRPMHADEAILADKFGALLETGAYDYDPHDYHGPALLYATLIPAWLRGIHRYADLDEVALRTVPVFFGLALVALPLLLADALGGAAALAASGLMAVSPAMIYYSRYYIPEMPLACFLLAVIVFGYRYTWTGRVRWAVLAGLALGLAVAAKETAALSVLAIAVGLALTSRKFGNPRILFAALGAAVLASAALITSFFRHPGAIVQYVQAFANYTGRGFGNGPHAHPWHYYLGLLFRAEAVFIFLAVVGAVTVYRLKDARLLRFFLFYTAVLIALYSVIPYKTPWCVLTPLTGMAVLAGAGTVALFRWRKAAGAAVLGAGLFQMYAAGSSTYAYSQTSRDVYAIRDRIEALAAVHPGRHAMPVAVFGKQNLWPLPWYFRSFTAVRWWTGVPHQKPPAPALIAPPDLEPELARMIYEYAPPGERELYMNMFEHDIELRPGLELRGYVAKSLWDKLQR